MVDLINFDDFNFGVQTKIVNKIKDILKPLGVNLDSVYLSKDSPDSFSLVDSRLRHDNKYVIGFHSNIKPDRWKYVWIRNPAKPKEKISTYVPVTFVTSFNSIIPKIERILVNFFPEVMPKEAPKIDGIPFAEQLSLFNKFKDAIHKKGLTLDEIVTVTDKFGYKEYRAKTIENYEGNPLCKLVAFSSKKIFEISLYYKIIPKSMKAEYRSYGTFGRFNNDLLDYDPIKMVDPKYNKVITMFDIQPNYFILEGNHITFKPDKYGGISSVRGVGKMQKLPYVFGDAVGVVYLSNMGLTSLYGVPKKFTELNLDNNLLSKFEYLISGKTLTITKNFFKSLEGMPDVQILNVSQNKLIDLKGVSSTVKILFCFDNPLKTIIDLPKDIEKIHLDYSKNLGLMKLLFCKARIESTPFQFENIFFKFKELPLTKQNILLCQKELMDNGFVGNAGF